MCCLKALEKFTSEGAISPEEYQAGVRATLAREGKLALDLNAAGFKPDALRVLKRVKIMQGEVAAF